MLFGGILGFAFGFMLGRYPQIVTSTAKTAVAAIKSFFTKNNE
jgi:hypothetical protein